MNLIERRRQMMMSKSKPYDAEIEYLESNGTQYIDTGFNLTNDIEELHIHFQGITNPKFWFGANSTGGTEIMIGYSTSNIYVDGISVNVSSSIQSDNIWDVEMSIVSNNQLLVVNGDNYNVQSSRNPNGKKIYLFAILGSSMSTSPNLYPSIRLFSFSITKNSLKTLDLIPVRVGQVGYMYDKVSGQLFGNQGTGDFVLGPDKN